MRVFVAFDGDTIGQMVGRARQADDVEAVRRTSQRIDLGNELWRAWATNSGGSVIEIGGDEGAVEVPADKLDELPAIRAQYADKVEASVSVGVGMKLSEASKALLAAKLRGKDQIVFYTEDCDRLIEEAQKRNQDEEGKIADEYLNKAQPAMNPHAFSGAKRPAAPSVQQPTATQGDHSAAQDVYDVVGDENAPDAPEATHAAKDFERQLHEEAWKGHEQDVQGDVESKRNVEQVKGAVAQALVLLKQQAPVLEQLKQAAPQAYAAVMQLAQAVIAITRELVPQDNARIQKSEDSLSAGAPMAKALRAPKPEEREELVHYSTTPGLHQVDVGHMGSGAPAAEYRQGRPEVPRAYYYRAGSKPEPIVAQGAKAVYRAQLDTKKQRLYDLGADAEGLRPASREKFLAGEGLNSPEDTLLDAVKGRGYYGYWNSASSMPHVVALFHPHPVHEVEMKKGEEYPPRMTHAQVSAYMKRLNPFEEYANPPGQPEEYELQDIPVPPPSRSGWAGDVVKEYAARTTPFPPIVMNYEGISDGRHRVAAAHARGDKTIRAYIPIKKSALPMPKAPTRHNVVLPVGSTVDQKVKVQHQDGMTSWKQMQAGAIRSMDPAGHPTSSRSPNSK